MRTSHDAYVERRLAGIGILKASHLPAHMRATALYGSPEARQALEAAPDGITGGEPLDAWIQRGEWIAQCPDCLSAQLVHPEQGVFFCAGCGNAGAGGLSRQLKFPPESDRQRIESLLWSRPRAENRNWLPHETIETIETENHSRGIGAPR